MSKPYDATRQFLMQLLPSAWPAFLGITTDAPVVVINSNLSTVSSQADVVLRISEETPWLLHIEFQMGPEMLPVGRRFCRYNIQLDEAEDLPVWTEVIQLRRSADNPKLTGVYQRGLPSGLGYHEFRYGVTQVWEQSLQRILAQGPSIWPLAPLTDEATAQLPSVIQKLKELSDLQLPPDQRQDFWTATSVLLGARYKFDFVKELLKGICIMRESSVIQHFLEEGREEGRILEVRRLLVRLGTRRFGIPNSDVMAKIEAIKDPATLESLCENVQDISVWDDLLSGSKL